MLLDAGFLKRKLGSQEHPLAAQQVLDFTDDVRARPELSGHHLHRIYYYDAEPLSGIKPKPLTGCTGNWETVDFSKNLNL